MEFEEDQGLSDRLLQLLLVQKSSEKPLPHMTELIQCLTRSYYNRKGGNDIGDYRPAKETVIFAIGRALEDVLMAPHSRHRKGVWDGISYEVDALALDPLSDLPLHVELKSTRYSTGKDPQEYSSNWHKQLLGYMYVLNKTTMYLAVLHLIQAELKMWKVTATEDELGANWYWLQERKVAYMGHIEREESPAAFQWNEEWECDNCMYKVMCDVEAARTRLMEAKQ